jgi:uncharacterized membrane protein YjdF
MNKTYIPALLFLILLALFHYFGNHFYLYVRINGYDIMMHILGGMGVALSVYWVLKTFCKGHTFSSYFWPLIIITFIGGCAWEIMEAYYDIAGAPVGTVAYWIDTIKDLFDDTLGAVIIYFSIRKK